MTSYSPFFKYRVEGPKRKPAPQRPKEPPLPLTRERMNLMAPDAATRHRWDSRWACKAATVKPRRSTRATYTPTEK